MAKYVDEILNPYLLSVPSSESVDNALLGILAMGITAVPVVSDDGQPLGMISLRDLLGEERSGTVAERMTKPVHVIAQGAEIHEAGRQMAAHDVHHLVAVDEEERVVGIVSSIDVVRALLGIPMRYPETFPRVDAEGFAWTDPSELDLEHASLAPDGPGLLVLIHGGANQPELPVWAESSGNLRARVHELLSIPQSETPQLARLLVHGRGYLRFRAAPMEDPIKRAEGLERAREQVERGSGLPDPAKDSLA